MRPLHVGLVLGAVAIALAGLAYVFTEGAMFSTGHHEWRIEVAPEGEGAWALYVPRIVAEDASSMEPLDEMLSTIEVVEGRAGFALDHVRMRIDGEGNATLAARREFNGFGDTGSREAFSRWMVANMTATHVEGPPLAVTWAVDFSGGEGHTCWGKGEFHARVADGGNATLDAGQRSAMARPWDVVCA